MDVQKIVQKHMISTIRGTTSHPRCHEFVALLLEIFSDDDYDAFVGGGRSLRGS